MSVARILAYLRPILPRRAHRVVVRRFFDAPTQVERLAMLGGRVGRPPFCTIRVERCPLH